MAEQEHPPAREHAKALWALCWRMVLLTPLSLLGMVAFVIILALSSLGPLCAVALLITGHYLLAVVALGLWLAWLRFGTPVRRWAYEGFEHASL